MRIEGDYQKDGYATVRGLVPPEVASNLFKQIQLDLQSSGKSFDSFAQTHPLSKQQTVDISGHFYRPLTTFLWGLTPIMCQVTGADLLPSYDYFRIYHGDDVCRVHSDRPSSEHAMSLTLVYGDGKPWPLEVGSIPVKTEAPAVDDWGDEPYTAVAMGPATRWSIAASTCAMRGRCPTPTPGPLTSSSSGSNAAARSSNTPSTSTACGRSSSG